jgi:hypothetical protein
MRKFLLAEGLSLGSGALLRKCVLGLLTALLLSGASATPDVIGYVASRPEGVILLYKAPCQEPVLSKIPEKLRSQFGAAKGVFKDGTFAGCWSSLDNGTAVFLWENGDYGWEYQSKFRLLRET